MEMGMEMEAGTTSCPQTNGTQWDALLSGEAATRAREAIDAISAALEGPLPGWAPSALLDNGYPGFALFHAYRYAVEQEPRQRELALASMERSIDALARTQMSATLFGGFAGPAWVVEHLASRVGALDVDLEAIDDALLLAVRRTWEQPAWSVEFDLLYGLVGYGVYALERMPNDRAVTLLELVVDRLDEVATRQDGIGVSWWTDPRQLPAISLNKVPEGCFNLGVAHGTPGVIAFLAQVCDSGVAEGKARSLLDQALSWLAAQRLGGSTAEFPTWVAPDDAPPASRWAWCYGNPGMAAALLCAARSVNDQALAAEALQMALCCAKRAAEYTGTVDACLCHGAAGNGHLFNRLFQATGNPRLREAAVSCFETAFGFFRPPAGVGGFATWGQRPDGEPGWIDSPGFLVGAAGVGLCLLAATSAVEPAWDRLLLVSGKPGIRG